eukprot:1013328-Alexandrium_andersonii.AAC.1
MWPGKGSEQWGQQSSSEAWKVARGIASGARVAARLKPHRAPALVGRALNMAWFPPRCRACRPRWTGTPSGATAAS